MKYNSVKAIEMLLKGKKMCYQGHNHSTGSYYDVSYANGYEKSKISPQIVEHNGDGSVYKNNVNIIDFGLFVGNNKFIKKKNWIIAKPKDFGLLTFPETKREPRKIIKENPVSWFKKLLTKWVEE